MAITLLINVNIACFNNINDLSNPTMVGVGKELVGNW